MVLKQFNQDEFNINMINDRLQKKLNNVLSCLLQKKNNRIITSIMFCLSGLTLLIIQYRAQMFIYFDTANYAQRMVLLSRGDILGPDIIQPLGLSILGLPFFMLGLSPYFSFVIVNFIFFCLLIWSSGEITYKFNTPLVTLMVYMIIAFEPIFSFTILGGIADVPFCSLLSLFLLLCLSNISIRNSILLGIVAAFSAYLRYPGGFLIVPLFIGQIVRNKSIKAFLLYSTISISSFIIVLGPMLIRNYLSAGNPIWLGYGDSGIIQHIQQASTWGTAVKWMFGFWSSLKFIPFEWFDTLVGNKIIVFSFLSVSMIIVTAMIYYAVIYKNNVALFMSIVCFVAYTGAMIMIKAHLESRYLMPSIFFFIISLVCFLRIKYRMNKLIYLGMTLLLAHGMTSSIYMAFIGYNLKGIPNYNQILKETTISGDCSKKVIMDSKSWPLYSLLPQMEPIGIIYDVAKTKNVYDLISSKDEVLLVALSERGDKPKYEPIQTPWRRYVKSLCKKYPDNFTIRKDNIWILVVERKGNSLGIL